MRHRFLTLASLPALAAAGILAALTLAPAANAWNPSSLPPGWTADHIIDVAQGSPCPEAYRIRTPTMFSDPFCTNSPTYQQDFDAWVDTHYTAPATTTATFSSTTTAASTTPATATDPTSTQPAPPAATTDYQAQIDDLKSQIAALKLRVDRLEAAADAEWLAYHDALVAGVDPVIASMIARQAGYDLIHGTGAFAP